MLLFACLASLGVMDEQYMCPPRFIRKRDADAEWKGSDSRRLELGMEYGLAQISTVLSDASSLLALCQTVGFVEVLG